MWVFILEQYYFNFKKEKGKRKEKREKRKEKREKRKEKNGC
jgi:hypothetical protein